ADVTGPSGWAAPLLLPVLDGLSGVQVLTALPSVEDRGAGPLVSLLPPRPGRAWRGSFEGLATTGGMQSEPLAGPPPVAHYDSWQGGGFGVRGPLSGRVGLALAGTATSVSRRERDETELREGRARSLLVHIARHGPREDAHVLALVQDARHPDADRALFGDAARRRESFVHVQAGATWR